MRRFLVLAACVLAGRAQLPPFRAETRVVQVPVSVTNSEGKNVEGLTARDFQVMDDNTPREITLDVFGSQAAPISLAVAIQTSGLSTPALAKIRRIGALIQPLVIGRRGEAAVLTFDSTVDWRLHFTSESGLIEQSIRTVAPGSDDQARMLDAVVEAAKRLRERPGRKVLMLVSESRDRGSHAGIESAIEAVEREGVEVFAAPYSAFAAAFTVKAEQLPPPSGANYFAIFRELARLGKTNDVQALADATGGSMYPFVRQRSAEKAIEYLGVELHSQYILSFPQEKVSSGMHRIDVSVPNRPGLMIRSRRAYWVD